MSIDFPANPATNDTYTVGGTTYIFDGTKWTSQSTVTESPNTTVINYVVKSANYTASVGDGVLTDTTSGSFTVALPASPSIGDTVIIADGKDSWGTNNLIIDGNGETIENSSEDLIGDISSVSISFVYDGTTWVTYAQLGAGEGEAITTDNTATLSNKTLVDPIITLNGDEGTAGQAIVSQGAELPPIYAPAGATLSVESSSSSNYYPTLSDSTSGSFTNAYVSDTKLFFQPSTGTLNATALNSLSDRRFKNNIQTIDSALDKVNSLTGVSFMFKNTGKESIGLIAQDVNEVVPEVVEHNEETDTMTVSYGNLVGLLVEAIKEQQIEINNLKKNQLDGK